MPSHPKGGRFRLLVDLLEHEMAKAALIRHVLGAAKQAGAALNPLAHSVIKLDAQRGEQGHLAVFHRQNRAGKARQGRGVAGAKKLPLPQADQQGRSLTGHH